MCYSGSSCCYPVNKKERTDRGLRNSGVYRVKKNWATFYMDFHRDLDSGAYMNVNFNIF